MIVSKFRNDDDFFKKCRFQIPVRKRLSLFHKMKFYDKYPQLKEKKFLAQVLTNSVFSTMSLEAQQVAKPKIKELVLSLLKEQELKGNQFFANQSI